MPPCNKCRVKTSTRFPARSPCGRVLARMRVAVLVVCALAGLALASAIQVRALLVARRPRLAAPMCGRAGRCAVGNKTRARWAALRVCHRVAGAFGSIAQPSGFRFMRTRGGDACTAVGGMCQVAPMCIVFSLCAGRSWPPCLRECCRRTTHRAPGFTNPASAPARPTSSAAWCVHLHPRWHGLISQLSSRRSASAVCSLRVAAPPPQHRRRMLRRGASPACV